MSKVEFRTKTGHKVFFYTKKSSGSAKAPPPTPAQKEARKKFTDRFAYGLGRGYAYQQHVAKKTSKKAGPAVRGLGRGIAFGLGLYQGVRRKK